MDIYLWNSAMFRLNQEQIDALKLSAQQGDSLSCYRLARYHISVRPEVESVSFAEELFHRAADAGVADATAALALMWKSGDMGLVDMLEYKQLMDKSFADGSHLAAKCVLLDMIYGRGRQADINGAISHLNTLMSQSNEPTWLYIMGCAIEELTADREQAAEWFRKAVDAGVTDAYIDLASVTVIGNSGEIDDYDGYIELLERGIAAGDGQSLTLAVLESISAIDVCKDAQQAQQYRADAIADLEYALTLGDPYAAYQLGEIYLNGSYGVEQSVDTAWQYYTRGVILGSAFCCEVMYDLMDEGVVTEDDNSKAQIALWAARYGSWRMKGEVVKLYKAGQLSPFTPEIEQYYLPLFDNENQ